MKKVLSIMIALVFVATAVQSSAQVTIAWTGQNDNIVATNAAGGVSFGNHQSGNIILHGGTQSNLNVGTLGVPEVTNTLESFSVYPNPTTGLVFNDIPENIIVHVYSLQGQLVHRSAGQLDITSLPPGVYIIGAPGYNPSMIVKQ